MRLARAPSLKAMPLVDAREASDFTPLTAQQAQAFRARHAMLSPWWVVLAQVVVGSVVVILTWFVTGSGQTAISAACGALAVIIPALLFARGMTSQFSRANAGTAVVGFFAWELLKLAVTGAVFVIASKVVENLSWPAMLLGLVLTLKVYWVALLVRPKSRNI